MNGKTVGEHQGGYDPFTVDITEALTTAGTQDLIVKVIDTTGQGNYPYQPRGKQSLTPGGIFYTSSSGIWQTVWLETVPASYISDLLIVSVYHDEDAEVYLDGNLVGRLPLYLGVYGATPIPSFITGAHTLALHCHQTVGGQGIDCGVLDFLGTAP
jgi:hypothetical protein